MLNERYEGMLENCPKWGRNLGLDLGQWTMAENTEFKDSRQGWKPLLWLSPACWENTESSEEGRQLRALVFGTRCREREQERPIQQKGLRGPSDPKILGKP